MSEGIITLGIGSAPGSIVPWLLLGLTPTGPTAMHKLDVGMRDAAVWRASVGDSIVWRVSMADAVVSDVRLNSATR